MQHFGEVPLRRRCSSIMAAVPRPAPSFMESSCESRAEEGAMGGTIVFIHGEFLTPKTWEPWWRFFSERGYRCVAPAWPWHDGEPEILRERIPAETGHVALRDI